VSLILVSIDSSYTTSHAVNSNFCSRTHRLATVHIYVTDQQQMTDRRALRCSISATVSTVG